MGFNFCGDFYRKDWVSDTNIDASIFHYILLIPIGIFCAWVYYRSNKDKTIRFLVVLVIVVTGIALDLIITVPLFLGGDYIKFYSDPFLWVGIIAIIIIGVYNLIRKR